VAGIWSRLLGVPAQGSTIALEDGRQTVAFVPAGRDEAERIVEVRAAAPGRTGDAVIAGVRFRCTDEGTDR